VLWQGYHSLGEHEKAVAAAADFFRYTRGDPDAPYMGALPKIPGINASPRYQKLLRDMQLDYWADKFSETDL